MLCFVFVGYPAPAYCVIYFHNAFFNSFPETTGEKALWLCVIKSDYYTSQGIMVSTNQELELEGDLFMANMSGTGVCIVQGHLKLLDGGNKAIVIPLKQIDYNISTCT